MQQQQQQQPANYDLLAVFTDEAKAEAATSKLHKEGFGEEEVYHLTEGTVGRGLYREHGPNRGRNEYFLQTRRTGPNPIVVVLFAVILGLVLGVLSFAASFALPTLRLQEPVTVLVGVVIGIVLGVIIGMVRRGRVRGAIGQKTSTPPPNARNKSAKTVVALRFIDPENISRKSRARAILLNNQGKIDRSVGQRE
ncbi:MAG TPA: hypothetical protein VHZ51_14515 [Ktedonobacteraceae bacterium]|jgi:hypothetical protein|nr:hypothetical protein [Ktedonobacteraceae bacterium]